VVEGLSYALPLEGVIDLAAERTRLTKAAEQFGARFFGNQARPNVILTAPGQIADETAKRLKEHCATDTYSVDMIPVTVYSIIKAYGGKLVRLYLERQLRIHT
jgi:hypothetical protein